MMNSNNLFFEIEHKRLGANSDLFVVGIDGPTASGKTMLANALKSKWQQHGIVCEIFELDWLLTARNSRLSDLKALEKAGAQFAHEDVFHMKLEVLADTLAQMKSSVGAENSKEIVLDGLYNREDGGRCTRAVRIDLSRTQILIVEGHYTLRACIDKYVDFNVALIANCDELIRRKVERVREYREPGAVESYFKNIDYPSFRKHFDLFSQSADLILDNTDWNSARKITAEQASRIFLAEDNREKTGLSEGEIFEYFIGIPEAHYNEAGLISSVFQGCPQIYRTINDALTKALMRSPKNLEVALLDSIKSQKDFEFNIEMVGSSNLANAYSRKFPISFGFLVSIPRSSDNLIQMDFDGRSLRVIHLWRGGILNYTYDYKGKFTALTPENKFVPKIFAPNEVIAQQLVGIHKFGESRLIGFEDRVCSEEEFLSEILNSTQSIALRRYAYNKEAKFVQRSLGEKGIKASVLGNYLLVGETKYFDKIKRKVSYSDYNEDLDLLRSENEAARFFEDCRHLHNRHGELFVIEYPGSESWVALVSELISGLSANNRLVRKACHTLLEKLCEKYQDLIDTQRLRSLIEIKASPMTYEASLFSDQALGLAFEVCSLRNAGVKCLVENRGQFSVLKLTESSCVEKIFHNSFSKLGFAHFDGIYAPIKLIRDYPREINQIIERNELTKIFIEVPESLSLDERRSMLNLFGGSLVAKLADKIFINDGVENSDLVQGSLSIFEPRAMNFEHAGLRLDPANKKYYSRARYILNDHVLSEINDILLSARLPKVRDTRSKFSPSMIEVQDLNKFKEHAEALIESGITQFHIDVGDGIFISRYICALDKVRMLRALDKDIEISVHLMVTNPHTTSPHHKEESYIEAYARAGATNIGVHSRAFDSKADFLECLGVIPSHGACPGIVLETKEQFDGALISIIERYHVKWLLMMSVEIGYGGQMFNANVVQKLYKSRVWRDQSFRGLTLEIDGGIAMNNLVQCRDAGADVIAGWSVVASENTADLLASVNRVEQLLGPSDV